MRLMFLFPQGGHDLDTDILKLKAMAEDTVTHKKLVMDNCQLLFNYFIENDQIQLGINLLKRGVTHDNSKLDNDEFKRMASILKSDECFKKASYTLSDTERKAIESHWKKNRHHPEYYDSPAEMSELDIIEMCCDWYARSLQYGTEFIPFIIERQHNRFKFDTEQFEKILFYCELLVRLHDNA